VVEAWCKCDELQNAGVPGNTCRTDYIRKILEHGVIARAPGENFNVAAVRSHRGAIDSRVSNVVGEASVSYVDEKVVETEKVRTDDGSCYVRDDKTP
jgi:hypothetical protein